MHRVVIVSFLAVACELAVAGPITISDFGPQARIETFESLADQKGTPAAPLVLNGVVFTTSSGFYRNLTPLSGGDVECLNGVGSCISTGLNDLEYMDVALPETSVRAGLWVGGWTFIEDFALSNVDVQFFNVVGDLLGTVNFSGPRMGFVGWESLPAQQRIARIRVNDLALNSRVVVVDNVIWDPRPVSEPGSVSLLIGGLVAFAFARRRQAN